MKAGGLWMATRVALWGTTLSLGAACGVASDKALTQEDKRTRLDAMVEQVYEDFPDVNHITAEELDRLMEEDNVVLVDVRTEDERRVSRIEGSITESEFLANLSAYQDRRVVAYCTVGVRSAEFAREMAERGVSISNVAGSILGWTHAGGELVDDDGLTRTLHVYGPTWDLAADGFTTVW